MNVMRDGAGPPQSCDSQVGVILNSSSSKVIYSLSSSSKVDAAAIIIILSHYDNIIAHFPLLVKPFAHFLADVEERPFRSVRRLRRLICFPRQAYKNENVFIILFESSKTLPHVDLNITSAAPELPQASRRKFLPRVNHVGSRSTLAQVDVSFILFFYICKNFSNQRTNFLTSCESFSIILM